jgi:hypothetical protein
MVNFFLARSDVKVWFGIVIVHNNLLGVRTGEQCRSDGRERGLAALHGHQPNRNHCQFTDKKIKKTI